MLRKTRNWPVMKGKCPTCPFIVDSSGRHRDPKLVERIQLRGLTYASHICHHPSLTDKKETHLCRGARDYQLMIFHRIGMLSEPTDAAWKEMATIVEQSKELRKNVDSRSKR